MNNQEANPTKEAISDAAYVLRQLPSAAAITVKSALANWNLFVLPIGIASAMALVGITPSEPKQPPLPKIHFDVIATAESILMPPHSVRPPLKWFPPLDEN